MGCLVSLHARRKKKLRSRASGENRPSERELSRWPIDQFEETWHFMGGELSAFNDASMYDFQVLRSSYNLKNGITEDAPQELTTTEDLDDLYSNLKPQET